MILHFDEILANDYFNYHEKRLYLRTPFFIFFKVMVLDDNSFQS